MTEDKTKDKTKEKETEWTINQGWDKQKMEQRRDKIKQMYIAAKVPYASDEKRLNCEVSAISFSHLTLEQIEEIVLNSETETKTGIEDKEDRKTAILKMMSEIYKNESEARKEYLAENFTKSNLSLEDIQELLTDIKKTEQYIKDSNMRSHPGVL